MMFGSKVGRLEATLRERHQLDPNTKRVIKRLRALGDVRNHIAHRMPGMGLGEEITFHFSKGSKATVLTVAKIDQHTTEARNLVPVVGALGRALRPNR